MQDDKDSLAFKRPEDTAASPISNASAPSRTITLDGYRRSGEGFTAESYFHEDGEHMLKLFMERIPQSEIDDEMRCSRAALRMGIPTPAAEELVEVDGRMGIIYELLHDKKSISRAIADDPGHMEDYAAQYAAAAKKLHATPCDKTVFGPVDATMRAAVAAANRLDDRDRDRIYRFLDTVEDTGTCLQGDFQTGNAVVSDGRIVFIDLGMFSYGNPLFDLGSLYFTAHDGNVEYSKLLFHNTPEALLRFWELFIMHYFELASEKEIPQVDEQIAPFAGLWILEMALHHPDSLDRLFHNVQSTLLDTID